MFACLQGDAKVVEYLLNLGADVNKECTQVMNTPLHYTCKWEDSGTMPRGIPRYYIDEEITVAEKVAIVKLLLKHGAIYKANSLGLTPICYAGLHRMRELVDLLGEMKLTTDAGGNVEMEKIKGLEFLAVSHAVQGQYMLHRADKLLICQCLIEAKQMHREGGSCSTPEGDRCYELQQEVFKRTECCSVEELEAIRKEEERKEGHYAVQIEGYLVGLRIIPDKLKPQYYWTALLDFTESLGDLAETCSIISYMLKVGKATETCDLETISSALEAAVRNKGPNLSALNDVLSLYFNALSTRPKEIIGSSEEDCIFSSVVRTLSNAALSSHGESFESFTTTLESVIRIVQYFQARNPSPSTREEGSFSSSWAMMGSLFYNLYDREVFDDEMYNFKFAFCRLLELDGATVKGNRGMTMLHLAAKLIENVGLYTAEGFELILSLVKIIIRHGCPLEEGYDGGETAEELVLAICECDTDDSDDSDTDDSDHDGTIAVRFVEALNSEHGSVLTLEELATRVILKWRIPYRDHLPTTLQEQVAGF